MLDHPPTTIGILHPPPLIRFYILSNFISTGHHQYPFHPGPQPWVGCFRRPPCTGQTGGEAFVNKSSALQLESALYVA